MTSAAEVLGNKETYEGSLSLLYFLDSLLSRFRIRSFRFFSSNIFVEAFKAILETLNILWGWVEDVEGLKTLEVVDLMGQKRCAVN